MRTLKDVFSCEDFELLQVVLAVVDFDRPNLRQAPSVGYLAFLAGMTEERFMMRLTELQKRNLLEFQGSPSDMTVFLGKLKENSNKVAGEKDK